MCKIRKVIFDFRMPGRIIASYPLDITEKERYSIHLQTEYKLLRTFIIEHQIQFVQDMQNISKAELLIRYLRNKAEVCAHIHEYGTRIDFNVSRGKTGIGGEGCNFVEIINQTLSMPHQFEEYINNNYDRFKRQPRAAWKIKEL